jgi:vancomycin resistance protein VanJ
MPPSNSETAPGFWRCKGCGTPNPRASYLIRCLGCGRPIHLEAAIGAVSTPGPTLTSSQKPRRGRKTLVLAALYAGIVLASVGMIRLMALSWWLIAALVFMPRWLFLAPILPMAFGAIRARRPWITGLVALDLLLVLGPLMGFSIPFERLTAGASDGPRVRIMTFNQGTTGVDGRRIIRYLERWQIDVVCFQELSSNHSLYESLAEAGWQMDQRHRIASRFPIVQDLGRSTDVNKSDSRYTMTLYRCRLRRPDGFEFLVGSAHLPTIRHGFSHLIARDFHGFRVNLSWWDEEVGRLREAIEESGETPVLVAGDFNMPSDYSSMASLRSTYPSAYEQSGWGFGYTRPTAIPWVRIDHILGSRDWAFQRCWVGPDFGSDHLPLIADAVLVRIPPKQ